MLVSAAYVNSSLISRGGEDGIGGPAHNLNSPVEMLTWTAQPTGTWGLSLCSLMLLSTVPELISMHYAILGRTRVLTQLAITHRNVCMIANRLIRVLIDIQAHQSHKRTIPRSRSTQIAIFPFSVLFRWLALKSAASGLWNKLCLHGRGSETWSVRTWHFANRTTEEISSESILGCVWIALTNTCNLARRFCRQSCVYTTLPWTFQSLYRARAIAFSMSRRTFW